MLKAHRDALKEGQVK
jgi:hypothetical protein